MINKSRLLFNKTSPLKNSIQKNLTDIIPYSMFHYKTGGKYFFISQ